MPLTEKARHDPGRGLFLPLVEQFFSIQGEGYHTGRAAWFIRLAGCDIGCSWCDSKHTWNADRFPRLPVAGIVEKAREAPVRDVVISGGEPLMHDLRPLTDLLKKESFTIYLETSGAYPLRGTFDWICLSPKEQKPPLPGIFPVAHELKVVIEAEKDFRWAEENAGKVREECHLFLQPEWSRYREVLPFMIEYVKGHPRWRISLQVHKFMHIP